MSLKSVVIFFVVKAKKLSIAALRFIFLTQNTKKRTHIWRHGKVNTILDFKS